MGCESIKVFFLTGLPKTGTTWCANFLSHFLEREVFLLMIREEEIMSFKVLQCGYPRSGNYFLWRLISLCQKKNGIYSSFLIKSGLSKMFEYLFDFKKIEPLFKEFFEVDEVIIEGKKSVVAKLPIEIDQELLLHSSSLIWTHSSPREIVDFALRIPLRFYLIRDGRDVVNSFIHHSCRENVRKLCGYQIKEPIQVYERFDIFEKYVRGWAEHVKSFLEWKQIFIEIRFEKLVNFGPHFQLILKLFSLEKEEKFFKSTLTFEKLKKENPEHIRKGQVGNWREFFTERHKEIFKEIAGDLLIRLSYEKDFNW
ncbi:MAG: sulfotransferase domain-containing protein [Desulfonauticus sp.]|nr:sulfotransferase domain-containing protein [Desulfonauticus sp.]